MIRKNDSGDEYLVELDVEALDEGGFVATSPDVQGLVAQGKTIAETVDIARDVARKIIESCIAHGDTLPKLRRRSKRKLVTTVPVHIVK